MAFRGRGVRGRQSDPATTLTADILAAVPEALVALDGSGVVIFANRAAAALLGWPEEQLMGTELRSRCHHQGANGSGGGGADCPVVACARDGAQHTRVEEVFWRPDGDAVVVEMSTAPIGGDEHRRGCLVVLAPRPEERTADYYDEVRRMAERERLQDEALQALQEAVQPPVPTVPGADLGVHFLAADPNEPSGGDLYDWQVLPDGDLHVAVVDVQGKGVAATKDALAVVHGLRVLVLEGVLMERLVARVDELLATSHPGLVATAIVARFSPSTGRLRLAGAGHPPPMIVAANGEVEEVATPGIAVGFPQAGSHQVIERTLERSDTLILYTDGLVEARRDIVAGLADLQVAAEETAGYPARHLPRVLIERALAGAQRRDDTLALVVRRRAAPADRTRATLRPFQHRFSPSMASVPVARHLFGEWLRQQEVDANDLADMLVVASELCTNAVRTASGKPGGVELRASVVGDGLVLEVSDDGPGFHPDPRQLEHQPESDQPSGRGLFIVRSMVDHVEVEPGPAGTVVRCTKRALFPEPIEAE